MSKKKFSKNFEKAINALLIIGLLAFVASVFYINLNANYKYYDGDIYCDIDYAKQAWDSKSIFPDGWVFGNQYYVVATPVLAALFYGIVGNGAVAMGLASSVMTVLIVLSYLWMLKPFASFKSRACGFLGVVCASAAVLHPLKNIVGWQMFFTMASYYSCYLITALLTFGCYLRLRENKGGFSLIIACLLSFALSFATGIQSIRQTELTVLPLLVMETVFFIHNKAKKKKINLKTILFTILITASNIAGCVLIRKMPVKNHSIYGETSIISSFSLSEIFKKIRSLGKWVISPEYYISISGEILFALISIIVAIGIILMIKRFKKDKKMSAAFCLTLLIILSLGGVVFLLFFSNIEIRNTYFFMLYPLAAIGITYLVDNSKKQIPMLIMILCIGVIFGVKIIPTAITCSQNTNETHYGEIADYLCENDYKVVVSSFGGSSRIAIASDEKIKAGSYSYKVEDEHTYIVDYLCNPEIYTGKEKTAYVFNDDNIERADYLAKKNNATLKKVKTVKGDVLWYIFESSVPLY